MLCSRRRFLQSGALAGAAGFIPLSLLTGDRTVRVALSGAGNMGMRHILTAGSLDAVDLVAIADPVQSRATSGADVARSLGHTNVRVYDDFGELLESEKPDLVVVSAPDHWHIHQCLAALDQGASVLLETLPVRTEAELIQLRQAASQYCNKLMISAPWRYSCGLQKARRIIAGGTVGDIELIRVVAERNQVRSTCGETPSELVRWESWLGDTSWPERSRQRLLDNWFQWWAFGSGIFSGDGFRLLDEVWWVSGTPTVQHVFAAGGTPGSRNRNRFPSRLIACVESSNGKLSWEHNVRSVANIEGESSRGFSTVVRGSKSSLHWGSDAGVTIVSADGKQVLNIAPDSDEFLERALWKDVVGAVQNRRSSQVSGSEFLASTDLVLEIIKAWATSRTIYPYAQAGQLARAS